MASQRAKLAVGLFMIAGICIALAAFILLGMSSLLQKGRYYSAYFNESVQGLEKDSPVKYRGVPIGRVERIGVAPDNRLIEVVLKVETLQEIDSTMVAQLKSVGITGSMFIELDRKRDEWLDQSPAIGFPSNYPVVSTRQSNISQLMQGLDDIINQIRLLDLRGISDKVKFTLDRTTQLIDDADIGGISSSLRSSLAELEHILARQRWDNLFESFESSLERLRGFVTSADSSLEGVDRTISHVDGMLQENRKTIQEAISEFRLAARKAGNLMENGNELVKGSEGYLKGISSHLTVIGQNMEKATENLNRVIELLAEQPSQIIFSDAPRPKKIEEPYSDESGGP